MTVLHRFYCNTLSLALTGDFFISRNSLTALTADLSLFQELFDCINEWAFFFPGTVWLHYLVGLVIVSSSFILMQVIINWNKCQKSMYFFCFLSSQILYYVKIPTIVGIFTFMSRMNFMLSFVEHEKSHIKKSYNLGAWAQYAQSEHLWLFDFLFVVVIHLSAIA